MSKREENNCKAAITAATKAVSKLSELIGALNKGQSVRTLKKHHIGAEGYIEKIARYIQE